MESIKVYRNIDAANAQASFAISRMEDIYAKRNGQTDAPHRHDYYTVLVVDEAQGEHHIDFNAYTLLGKQVYFVAPGQVHQVIEHQVSRGYAMTFSTQFLIENGIHISFIESLNLFHNYGQSPPLKPEETQFKEVTDLTHKIWQLFNGDGNMKFHSIGAYLKLFLIQCNSICSLNPIEAYSDISENSTIRKFKQHVNEHYKTEHSTSFYAKLQHITPDHLNRVIKTALGKTAKEYIQARITTEAKRLLFFSKLTHKEIGYALGFNEPANFSAFFKKCTGYAPSNFVKQESPRGASDFHK